MKVPFSDLRLQHEETRAGLEKAYQRVLGRGDFILGEDVRLFEQEFAALCGAASACGVNSGTDALFLACKALKIGPGDEVIVPAFTYIATALAVSYTGATPVFADIDEKTYNLDPKLVKAAITSRTRAIIPVHLYGQPADMPALLSVARARGIKVIEDAAQSHGARIKTGTSWATTGSLGDCACFSFYPSKNLGALGDGGIVTTSDGTLDASLRMLRDYGRVSKYEHSLIGFNARLDTLQAAFLRVKLKRLKRWNAGRRRAAAVYDRLLAAVPGVVTPWVSPDVEHVYHCYAVRCENRDTVYQKLLDNGVTAIIHYPIPVHLQKAYAGLGYRRGDFPVSEKVSREILSLPMFPHMTERQIAYVVSILKGA
jgi:dTDP-4-amino-4,6-dideoxygalactose transaminase